MATSVKINDHSSEVIDVLIKARKRALTAAGILVQGSATENATLSVDTGRLRASISYNVENEGVITPNTAVANSDPKDTMITGVPKAVVIGTNVVYARRIEFGWSKRQPKGYLRIAVDDNRSKIKRVINAEYEKGLK